MRALHPERPVGASCGSDDLAAVHAMRLTALLATVDLDREVPSAADD